jgi:type III pantothenate kinase
VRRLLIDAGNSRIKWARLKGGRLGRVHAIEWSARNAGRAARAVLRGRYDKIVACSVAGPGLELALRRAARRGGNPAPQFIRSTRRAAGVRNGYAQTWRLGADRWVAMLGGRALYPGRALCVVDVGTALTLDLLDARGRHCGGLLTPGPGLMVELLLSRTAGIRRRAGLPPSGGSQARAMRKRPAVLFGRSTRAGLLAGSVLACAALIERALGAARDTVGARPKLLLAGGGARAVAALLRTPYVRSDHLVLQGLALLARADSR